MQLERASKAAGAGTNYLNITLPEGSKLLVVNVFNETTGWQRTTLDVSRYNDPDGGAYTIALHHRTIQPGLKSVHWEGNLTLTLPYVKVTGTFEGCVAADKLHMVVGYE